jgi:hypothetical protein
VATAQVLQREGYSWQIGIVVLDVITVGLYGKAVGFA